MERKLDFVLDDNSEERLLFRFYPRQSHCHGFSDKIPKTWQEVYKVYYSWSIIQQYKANNKVTKTRIMYKELCDECSCLDQIAFACEKLCDGIECVEINDTKTFEASKGASQHSRTINLLNNEFYPAGYGTSWRIVKRDYNWLLNNTTRYRFILFGWDDIGFRFTLNNKEKVKEFGEFLKQCCEYMLSHAEPI